ncbi:MAG: hypothetical protein A2Z83_08600 [Omnitrophica bacterium GWA2_52_8]|nr:MAG: hypothetical protein A2Z83_08600 [Omnitrophica bacterium GWA2_52_8]
MIFDLSRNHLIIYYSAALLAMATVAFRKRKFHGHNSNLAEFLFLAALGLTVCVLLGEKIFSSVYQYHNWSRLQKTFAIAYGFRLYYPADAGPAMITLYGPIAALAYLPAAGSSSPMTAMRLAETLNIFYFFFPAFLILRLPASHAVSERLHRTMLFLIFCMLSFLSSTLKEAAFNVHADAVTLGFAAMACYFLQKYDWDLKKKWLWLSAFFAVSSVWSKQVAVPVVIALPLYLYFRYGLKTAARYLFCLFGTGTALLVLFVWMYGIHDMFVNMFYIPGRHPYRDGGGFPVGFKSAVKLARECLLPWVILLILFIGAGRGNKQSATPEGRWMRRPWFLYFFLGLWMIPVSILGNIKVGGSNNTFSYAVYFFTLAAATGFMTTGVLGGSLAGQKLTRAAGLLAFALCLIGIPMAYYRLWTSGRQHNFALEAYRYAQAHPGKTYFPTLPLIHLLAEKKLYHDVVALMDRDWAGIKITEEHLRAHLPAQLEVIAFPDVSDKLIDWIPLKEFKLGAEDEELPGFLVYRKYDPEREKRFTGRTWQEAGLA